MNFDPEMTLAEARVALREVVDDGHTCPVCTQFAKVYRRSIHAAMAVGLIRFYRKFAMNYGFVPDALPADRIAADFAKLRYWNLIEEELGRREDGSTRTGRWRLTIPGQEFVLGFAFVQKHARIYDSRCLGLEGPLVTIRECLGKKFDYEELMSA